MPFRRRGCAVHRDPPLEVEHRDVDVVGAGYGRARDALEPPRGVAFLAIAARLAERRYAGTVIRARDTRARVRARATSRAAARSRIVAARGARSSGRSRTRRPTAPRGHAAPVAAVVVRTSTRVVRSSGATGIPSSAALRARATGSRAFAGGASLLVRPRGTPPLRVPAAREQRHDHEHPEASSGEPHSTFLPAPAKRATLPPAGDRAGTRRAAQVRSDSTSRGRALFRRVPRPNRRCEPRPQRAWSRA